jgi:tRNA pseudouridine55 synthase
VTSVKTVNGWLILDKPLGMTSTTASSLVRRLLGARKAGHAGTLDPLATGVLPIAVGEATKTMVYTGEDKKQYRFQVTWGEQRITDDREGGIIAVSHNRPCLDSILSILPRFTGVIWQRPPIFSALKVGGKRAYDLARSGSIPVREYLEKSMMAKTRNVVIHELILESVDSVDQATFLVTCGTGTYVRSLARDMAENLNTRGYVSILRRTCAGKFNESVAISLEKLRELVHKSELHLVLLPPETVLDDIPAVPLTKEEAVRVYHGREIWVSGRCPPGSSPITLWFGGQLLAIARTKAGLLGYDSPYCPKRVFNIPDLTL